ncbi:MAG: hypothetical protein H6Q41_5998 [Deltaproteobacteria bacterium]|nr:hypothetical protein [Deltaproteobacteria bacterium]
MEKENRDYISDSALDKLNGSRRVFLKGLIASGVGGVGGAVLRPTPGMASEGAAIQKNRKSVAEPKKRVPITEDVDVLARGGRRDGRCWRSRRSRKDGVKNTSCGVFWMYGGKRNFGDGE